MISFSYIGLYVKNVGALNQKNDLTQPMCGLRQCLWNSRFCSIGGQELRLWWAGAPPGHKMWGGHMESANHIL